MSRSSPKTKPVNVLCISGHDPSGGAGLQADIESVRACGGIASTIPSCLTVQTAREFVSMEAVDNKLMHAMLERLWAHDKPDAIKIGLLGHADQARMLGRWFQEREKRPPLVLDPVLKASAGKRLSGNDLYEAIRSELLPHATLITPNHLEARSLSGKEDIEQAIETLLTLGSQNVLLTGGDEAGDIITNTLHSAEGQKESWQHRKINSEFHGTGCTLASATACYLAQGHNVRDACHAGQRLTQKALAAAFIPTSGPAIPYRVSHND